MMESLTDELYAKARKVGFFKFIIFILLSHIALVELCSILFICLVVFSSVDYRFVVSGFLSFNAYFVLIDGLFSLFLATTNNKGHNGPRWRKFCTFQVKRKI